MSNTILNHEYQSLEIDEGKNLHEVQVNKG